MNGARFKCFLYHYLTSLQIPQYIFLGFPAKNPKAQGRSFGISDFIKLISPCPPGSIRKTGQNRNAVLTSFQSTSILSCSETAYSVKYTSNCKSFSYSSTKKTCNLMTTLNPTTSTDNFDYVYCSKIKAGAKGM